MSGGFPQRKLSRFTMFQHAHLPSDPGSPLVRLRQPCQLPDGKAVCHSALQPCEGEPELVAPEGAAMNAVQLLPREYLAVRK